MRLAGKDIIDLAQGEPDFDTPHHVKAAAVVPGSVFAPSPCSAFYSQLRQNVLKMQWEVSLEPAASSPNQNTLGGITIEAAEPTAQ
ncbi:hypothetical protein DXT91_28365 [Agrobacterium tumefaciens]|nr:hypothetical protein [Agrobacterium tumefaciens]